MSECSKRTIEQAEELSGFDAQVGHLHLGGPREVGMDL